MKTPLRKFHLTFDIVTEESATHGDFAFHGFVTRDGNFPADPVDTFPKIPPGSLFREALEMMDSHDDGSEPREADSFPCAVPRWFHCRNYDGEESVTLSMHLDCVTPSTAARIARMAGVRLSR